MLKPNQPLSHQSASSPAAWNTSSAAPSSIAIRRIGIVGDPRVSVLGGDHDLLAAVAARAVLPDHRLEDQRHADREDEAVVELLAQIGSDQRRFGGVGADAVTQIEVR